MTAVASDLEGRRMSLTDDVWRLDRIDRSSQRLRMRPFVLGDVSDEYLSWLNDPWHMRFSNQRFVTHTPQSVADYLESFSGTSSLFLALEEASTGRLAGTATVYSSPHHGTADVGLMVGVPFAGRHFGREAVECLREALFEQAFRKVTLGTSSRNLAMVGILRSLAFLPDGVRIRQELVEGEEADILYFASFRPSDANG